MFDIGFWELAIIAVIALIVVGPEKLPGLARQAGRWVGKAQRMASDLKNEVSREADFQEFRKLKEEFESGELQDVVKEMRDLRRLEGQDLATRLAVMRAEAAGAAGAIAASADATGAAAQQSDAPASPNASAAPAEEGVREAPDTPSPDGSTDDGARS